VELDGGGAAVATALRLPGSFCNLESSFSPRPAASGGYVAGVFLSQIVNNALHLVQPLLIIQLSGSLGTAAFFSAFDTAVHMAGTLAGGWPADRLGPRRLLMTSTFLRAAALALIPAAWAAGRLTLHWAMAAYTLDAFFRGFTDTAAHAWPIRLAKGDRAQLDRLNSRYEFAFDLGGVVGPVLLALQMLTKKGLATHIIIAAGFAASAIAFAALPRERLHEARRKPRANFSDLFAGVRLVAASPSLLFACAGLSFLNLYPLRKLMSAFFAKSIILKPEAAGWIGAAFGLGGVVGSLIYGFRGGRGSGTAWVAAAACGVVALAAGWMSSSLAAMLVCSFIFSVANVGARLALTRRVQLLTPLKVAGSVTAAARFSANGVSVLLKTLVGAAFALAAGRRLGFAAVGACLGLLALAQFALSARLASAE
jgi:predicted MFS family arabinose efflux permease